MPNRKGAKYIRHRISIQVLSLWVNKRPSKPSKDQSHLKIKDQLSTPPFRSQADFSTMAPRWAKEKQVCPNVFEIIAGLRYWLMIGTSGWSRNTELKWVVMGYNKYYPRGSTMDPTPWSKVSWISFPPAAAKCSWKSPGKLRTGGWKSNNGR